MSLQGTLATLGITEVLEFLASRDATGQLDITTEMGSATYLFHEGDVSQSEYSFIRESGTDAAEATYYVVSELDGTFFFDEDQEPIEVDDVEDVGSVLSRTAEIAEKWQQVEASIETPNHLLVRNNQLDGSVTIQPEWWNTLEVIGDGKTSMQVAADLDMGLLPASLLVLDMTDAGLLKVEEIDPMSLQVPEVAAVETDGEIDDDAPQVADEIVQPAAELDVEPLTLIPEGEAVSDEINAESSDVLDAPVLEAPSMPPAANITPPVEVQAVAEATQPAAAVDAPAPVEQVLAPMPVPESAPAPVAEPAPVAAMPAPVPEPVMEAQAEAVAPVATPAETFEPAFAPPTAFAETPPVEAQAPVAAQAPAPAPSAAPAVDDDDGWASDHSLSYDQAQNAAAPAPAAHAPAAAAEMQQPAPMADHVGELAPMPTAPQPHGGEALFNANPPVDAATDNVAGQVLDDLSSMTAELEQNPAANWELDGTFVADEAPVAPAPDENPFGELSGLITDDGSGDEDRGSVLKFLRRD